LDGYQDHRYRNYRGPKSYEKKLVLGEEEIEVLTGTYRVPQAGRYFLEIIVIYCEELSFESFNGKICIEDPDSNRLTDEGVFIDVLMEGEPSEEVSNKNSSVVGY